MGVSRRARWLISCNISWKFNKDLKRWFAKRARGVTLHLCCGLTKFSFAVNVDLDPQARADILADMFHLPFKDGVFDTIICDPPYRLAIHKKAAWVREMLRVVKKEIGSQILLKTDFIPYFGLTWQLQELIIYCGKKYWAPVSLLLQYKFVNTTLPSFSTPSYQPLTPSRPEKKVGKKVQGTGKGEP